MTQQEYDTLTKEFFEFEVTFENGSFGKFAKWENNYHPENPNFMQTVLWRAYENGDKSKIIVNFYLDRQLTCGFTFQVIDNGNFNNIIFDVWKSQLRKVTL